MNCLLPTYAMGAKQMDMTDTYTKLNIKTDSFIPLFVLHSYPKS